MDVGEFIGRRLYTGLTLDYRLRLKLQHPYRALSLRWLSFLFCVVLASACAINFVM